MKIKLSKTQWEEVGRKAGWMKTAANADVGNKYKLVDLNTYETLDTKWMSHEEHVTRNRALEGQGQRWDRIKEKFKEE